MPMPSLTSLKAMIADALKATDPQGFLKAKASGELDQIVASRAEAAMQTYRQMMENAEPEIESMATLGDQLRHQESVKRAAAETALSQATEFSPPSRPDQTED